jgi:hypothetical protein
MDRMRKEMLPPVIRGTSNNYCDILGETTSPVSIPEHYVGYSWYKDLDWGRFFGEYFGFPLSVSFHHRS